MSLNVLRLATKVGGSVQYLARSGCLASLIVISLFAIGLVDSLYALDSNRHSSQSLGAGGAYTAIAEGASAFGLNPAGLARFRSERRIFGENHFLVDQGRWKRRTNWRIGFSDTKTEDPLGFGFLASSLLLPERRRESFHLVPSLNIRDIVFVALGHEIIHVRRNPAQEKYWAFALNPGILVFPLDMIAIGLAVQSAHRSRSSSSEIPVVLQGGVSLNTRSFRIGADLERNFSQSTHQGRLGLEYSVSPLLVMRAGFFGDRKLNDRGYTLGFGLTFLGSLRLDAAFVDYLQSSSMTASSSLSIIF